MEHVTHEHIMVCLSSAPSNESTIRAAVKMSKAFGGTLTALYVQTKASQQMGTSDRQRLQRHARLAEELGASISTVTGDDVAYQIAEFARISNVTKIVLGRSSSSRNKLFAPKPLNEQVVGMAPHLDVFIIPDTAGVNRHHRNPATNQHIIPSIQDILITIALLTVSTIIGYVFHKLHFTEANIITIYILGVLLTALFTKNYMCSGIASLASVVLFNFFFTEPRLSLYAYESGYPVTFVIMLFASLLTGTLANRLAVHARQTTQTAWRTQVLLETTQRLVQTSQETEVFQVIANQLLKLLNRPLTIYPVKDDKLELPISYDPQNQENSVLAKEKNVAEWSFKNNKQAGASTEQYADAEGLYIPIQSNGVIYGVVGIGVIERPLEPFEKSVLMSMIGAGALSMEIIHNARQKEEAAVLAKNERLRANLLRSISHDLRTPLTSISGNAENLLSNGDAMEVSDRKTVLTDIYKDSIWLIRLVENLLAITKIGEGQTQLNMTTELVDEVIVESLRHIHSKNHSIQTHFGDEILLARMDARLISQVIVNLVDNAIKYTPDDSTICISAENQGNNIVVRIADDGPGIPDDMKPRVFDMFYAGNNGIADCRRSMGLGLHLCKSIIGLHGGEIQLTDNMPSGCVFSFSLPIKEVTFNE